MQTTHTALDTNLRRIYRLLRNIFVKDFYTGQTIPQRPMCFPIWLKERFVVTEYVLKGKPFKEIAQETDLTEKGVASAYYRSIKKLRAKMGDVE